MQRRSQAATLQKTRSARVAQQPECVLPRLQIPELVNAEANHSLHSTIRSTFRLNGVSTEGYLGPDCLNLPDCAARDPE